MPSKTVANHLHRYKKINIAGFRKPKFLVFKCTKPACFHYVRVDLAEGKLCECSRCNGPMIINKIALTQTYLHCSKCIKHKRTENVEAITEFLDGAKIPI